MRSKLPMHLSPRRRCPFVMLWEGSCARHMSALNVRAVKAPMSQRSYSMQAVTTMDLNMTKSVFQVTVSIPDHHTRPQPPC